MVEEENGFLDLASALEGLRTELETALHESKDQLVRFRAESITLTVQAVAKREAKGGAKIRWWLVEAGGEASRSTETLQTLVLTLTPGVHDPSGVLGPLEVSGKQLKPGD
jgi:hypothetical protein